MFLSSAGCPVLTLVPGPGLALNGPESYCLKLVNYVILQGILENNRKVLYKITDKKQNWLDSSCMKNISTTFLHQKMDKISYDNKF